MTTSGYITYGTIPGLIDAQTRNRPDTTAIVAPDRMPLTYRRLSEQIAQTADTLRAMGLSNGSRIVLVVNNRPDSVVSLLSIATYGTAIPLNPTLRPEEFDVLLTRTKAVALIVEAGLPNTGPALAEIADRQGITYIELASGAEAGVFSLSQRGKHKQGDQPPAANYKERQPDDTAVILTTSGTTSLPKIVPISHNQLCANAFYRVRSLELTEQDRLLLSMPVFHEGGLANMLASLSIGSSVAAMPAFDPVAFYTWLGEQQATWFTGTPTLLQALLLHAAAPDNQEIIARSGLRLMRTAGAYLYYSLAQEAERLFRIPVIQGYGSSEAGSVTCDPLVASLRKVGSVGISTGQEVAVVDDASPTLKFLQLGVTGEIVVRGPSVIKGYEDNPEANDKAFIDGWFRTGDQGYLDSDGYLFITGRIKELINRAGEKISPYEVEEVLLRHPAVAQAAVFAVQHPRLGEDAVAAVVLRPKEQHPAPTTERTLLEYAAEHLAAYKAPSRIILVDDIPKGHIGKIQRGQLAARLGLVTSGDSPAAMTEQERHKLLVEWNATAVDFGQDYQQGDRSAATLSQLFEAQVSRSPAAVAMICGEQQLSYGEVNVRANRLARYLSAQLDQHRADQAEPAVPIIALCMERSPQAIITMLAILKAGAAYLPLDLDHPAARLGAMLGDSRAWAVVADQSGQTVLAAQNLPAGLMMIALDDPSVTEQIAQQPDHNLPPVPHQNGADDPAAYVLYTSGSTGQPKGVVGTHRGMVNRIAWMARTFPFAPAEICCQKTSLGFVDSIAEIFGPLLHGVALVVIPPQEAIDPQLLIDALASRRVTRLVLVPSLLSALLDLYPDWRAKLPDLRLVTSSGEALPQSLAARFVEAAPHTRLLNFYGSTEVAADVTYYEVTSDELRDDGRDSDAFIPIGRPIANTQVYILDERLAPVPLGETGELYIGGAGLASGYLYRPDLTAEKFVASPFIPGARLFRSGDMACYVPDNAQEFRFSIQYVGRRDSQVKIRGVRVNPGEIEAVLLGYPGVKRAAVIAEADPADPINAQRLVAYLVQDAAHGEAGRKEASLRAYLRECLIAQMIPAAFVWRDALPMTPGGKIDRQALNLDRRSSEPTADSGLVAGSAESPVDSLQATLITLWQQALNRQSVGIHDDFFDLGGHSLLAARLFVRMRETLGVNLPLATLFRASTIAELADIIREGDVTSDDAVLIPLRSVEQTDGSRPPLFCFHALYGHVLVYDRLAQRLDSNQPVYAAQAPGVEGEQQPLKRIGDMALRYLREIRAIQSHGPYYLCGYSFGGRIALEVARLLRAEGETEVWLLMMDERLFASKFQVTWYGKPRSLLHWIGRRLQSLWFGLTLLPPNYRGRYLRQRGTAFKQWGSQFIPPTKPDNQAVPPKPRIANDLTDAVQLVAKANLEAAYAYEPAPYDGPITFLRAGNDMINIPQFRVLRYVAKGSLEIDDIPGSHETLLNDLYVGGVAARVQRWLNEANGR